ncbi:hypothetical protein ACI2JA_05145 [Alkalihalobacillus sp. NPDC078783]
MKRNLKKKIYLIGFSFLCFLLAACQSDDDQMKVIVFSDELYEQKEMIESEFVLDSNTEVTFFPEVQERLLTELASHQSSLLIVEGALAQQMVEYEALIPLEGFQSDLALNEYVKNDADQEEMKALNLNKSNVVELHDVELTEDHLVGIPVYSPEQEKATELVNILFSN